MLFVPRGCNHASRSEEGRAAKERFGIHHHVTNQIIAAIEQGACIESKKPYRGVNIVALWAESEQRGFTSGI